MLCTQNKIVSQAPTISIYLAIPGAPWLSGWPPDVALDMAMHPGFWMTLLIAGQRGS